MLYFATKNKNLKLSYHYYYYSLLALALLGLLDTSYLAWLHFKNYTDISFVSFCALSKTINCDTVSQSSYSIFWGIPVAYWGLFAYLFFFKLLIATRQPRPTTPNLWQTLCTLGAIYALASLVLGYISATRISAHCILCLVSHSISFALFFFSWIIVRRSCGGYSPARLRNEFQLIQNTFSLKIGLLILFFGLFVLKVWLPHYWEYTLPQGNEFVATGKTEDGHPWIGAEQPQLIIHEYTDYQCFQCGKMHQFLRRMIAEHPDKIRLVHHHYPMDHEFNNIIVPEPFHIGSGKMAMLGIYAAWNNKFWVMNDALYTIGRENKTFSTKTLAEKTGFTFGELTAALQHSQIQAALLNDIRQGMKLHITGTPAYVINGQVYIGSIPAEILSEGMR